MADSGKSTDPARKSLITAAMRLLVPLVRLFLRYGVSYQIADSLLRWVYVDVAAREFGIEGRAQSRSRVSVLTGLTRREVSRLMDMPAPAESRGPERYNRAARVLTGWIKDEDFLDAGGKPRVLPIESGKVSFQELVRRHSGNAPPRAVLDELERVGAVRRDGDAVTLLKPYYVPGEGRASDAEKLEILGMSATDLLATIGYNLAPDERGPFFQRVVYRRELSPAALAAARAYVRREGQALADRADSELYRISREHDGPGAESGSRAGVGIYYFEESPEGEPAV